jgi:hypothetical protein
MIYNSGRGEKLGRLTRIWATYVRQNVGEKIVGVEGEQNWLRITSNGRAQVRYYHT